MPSEDLYPFFLPMPPLHMDPISSHLLKDFTSAISLLSHSTGSFPLLWKHFQMTHLQKCKQTKMCSRPMSPSNSCLIFLFSFPNKAYHYNCPFLLSLFLISNSSLNHFNQALVTNDPHLAKANVCLIFFSVGILLNFSAAFDTVEHSVLYETFSSWASRTSHSPAFSPPFQPIVLPQSSVLNSLLSSIHILALSDFQPLCLIFFSTNFIVFPLNILLWKILSLPKSLKNSNIHTLFHETRQLLTVVCILSSSLHLSHISSHLIFYWITWKWVSINTFLP